MPIYEYQCGKCGKIFEQLVFSSQEKPPCPECGAKNVRKKISSFASPASSPKCPSAGSCEHAQGGGCACHCGCAGHHHHG